MVSKRYEQTQIIRLLPLLESIGREIQERSEALERVEARIEELSRSRDTIRQAQDEGAEASAHRRGLRLARREIDRLGCSVVKLRPLTFRIPGRVGKDTRNYVWQADPALLR